MPVRRRARQRGVILPLFLVGTVAVMAAVGLATDMGRLYLTKTRLQNAADAAALSGADKLMAFGSAAVATTAALEAFESNDAPGLSAVPTVETSPTLQPFAPGGADPSFVRITATQAVDVWLVDLLPEVPDTIDVTVRAVAGPIPLGGTICGAMPVMLCGTPGDTDCSDGSCYGLNVGGDVEVEFTGDNTSIGPGNYGFVVLTCGNGAACLRRSMAGGETMCFTEGGTVTSEPGFNAGPSAQGLNTRFGIYQGPVTSTQYPPDVVTDPLFHDEYEARLANPGSWNFPNGRPRRREVLMPVGDCSTPITGRTAVGVLGPICVFLTQPMAGTGSGAVRGQIIAECKGDGGAPEDPEPGGPYTIVLFQDARGQDS